EIIGLLNRDRQKPFSETLNSIIIRLVFTEGIIFADWQLFDDFLHRADDKRPVFLPKCKLIVYDLFEDFVFAKLAIEIQQDIPMGFVISLRKYILLVFGCTCKSIVDLIQEILIQVCA